MRPPRLGTWALKRVLFHSGLLTLAGLARRRPGALVLRYHAITPDADEVPYATPEICLPVAALRVQMAFVQRAYSVVPLDELVDGVRRGAPLPPRALAITFDDGYADNHRLAFPVLQRLGLPAAVYLTTGSMDGGPPLWMSAVRALALTAPAGELAVPGLPPVTLGGRAERGPIARALTRALVPLPADERDARLAAAASACGVDPAAVLADSMLDWDQVRELARAGWTIGAHTVTHVNVALAAPGEATAEIAASRDAIAAAIGSPVVHFAYPNTGGAHRYFDAPAAGILRRLGFRSAVTSAPGLVRPGIDPFAFPRIGVGPRLAPVSELAATLVRQRLAA